MPPASDKTLCPHCNTSYYPRWQASSLNTVAPDRGGAIAAGTLWSTTCTTCDRLMIEFEPPSQSGILFDDLHCRQVFPVPPEIAVEIIIQIFIDFENLQRRQDGEPEMNDDEEDETRTSFRDFFQSLWSVVRTGSGVIEVVNRFPTFFKQMQKLLPSPDVCSGED